MMLYDTIPVIIVWIVLMVALYFQRKKQRVPTNFFDFAVYAVGIFFFTAAVMALVDTKIFGDSMDSDLAREQSCEVVVKETAMVTSASVAIGTTTILLLLAVTPGVGPLAVVAIAVAGGSLGGIGGYVTGATLASSFSPSCQETGK